MFSFHRDRQNIGKAYCYARGWQTYESSALSLARALLKVPTSPITFRDGHRTEANFLSASWVGLDFDAGPSLDEIEQTFSDSIHVIGTTKSHRKAKGHYPACDRFRVWLKLEHTITTVVTYKATVRHLVKTYDADPACVGAAQMFWPCQAITSVLSEGYTTDVVIPKKIPSAKTRPEYNGQIPPWVNAWLNGDFDLTPERGEGRNRYVYKTALWLAKNGWDENRIMDVVMSSRIPISQEPQVEKEVLKAVRSGMRRALQDSGEGIKC